MFLYCGSWVRVKQTSVALKRSELNIPGLRSSLMTEVEIRTVQALQPCGQMAFQEKMSYFDFGISLSETKASTVKSMDKPW